MTASFAPASLANIVERVQLTANWEMAFSSDALTPDSLGGLQFVPAHVPGTAASALRAQGSWRPGAGVAFDNGEYWFCCRFDSEPAGADEEVVLEFGGIATLSEVWLNGEVILKSSSMFTAHRVNVSALIGHRNELMIVCRSVTSAIRARRSQSPRARWRTRVVGEQQLRWFRTTLLGRAPGFAPEPAPVGPWRPVTLVRHRYITPESFARVVQLDAATGTGIIRGEWRIRALSDDARPVAGWLCSGAARVQIHLESSDNESMGTAELRLPEVDRWWPHTHGNPVLYPLRVELELMNGATVTLEDAPVGFRDLTFLTARDAGRSGFSINGVSVFARGVIWMPPDSASPGSGGESVRNRLTLLRDAGFNLIRLAGTTVYEDETFHRLCDELGLLVWQDMMYANMDYPFADAAFLRDACLEAEVELYKVANHPSLAMVCGNSEIEQQVGMLGMDASEGRGPFFGVELPAIAARCCPGVPYIPSAPYGGDLPFRTNAGVANYFGVGAYLRPPEDARRADVRFASECLALANIPEPELIEKLACSVSGGISPTHPAWKRATPRDCGTGWDFEDVRDHYLKLLYSTEPIMLRYADVPRYWDLSRMVSGELMAEVFGEWRRAESQCGGGIILQSADLEPGAGWGILDSDGAPKAAYWFLKRALAPCTVWTSDEGLNGIDIHVANDGSEDVAAWLRVALYLNGEQKVEQAERRITINGHSAATISVEQIIGRFLDASYSYRFGPPRHDLISASLHTERDEPAFARSFRFSAGRTTTRVPISELGITAQLSARSDGTIHVLLESRRFANGVRVSGAHMRPDDSYFAIEPGGTRTITLMPLAPAPASTLFLTAINGEGRITIPVERTQ